MFGQPILWIVALLCALWVIYDVWMNNRKADKIMKIVWTLLAVFFNIITAIVYYVIYHLKR